MKLGQTSIVVFLSKLLGSALGFLATLYFARELGAEVLGVYALVLTVVGWLALVGQLGIGKAAEKRISEGEDRGKFFVATVLLVGLLGVVLTIGVVLSQPILESYISEFDAYVAISVVWFVIGLLFVLFFYKIVIRTLRGQQMVHIAGLLDPVKVGSQSLIQIGLVMMGYGLLGMLVGYIIGGIFIGVIGLFWITIRPTLPKKRHFQSLFDYAKFSWLGGFKSKTFNEVDILLLGVFVPSALVGVYSVTWTISKFLDLFGTAVRETMFPEISQSSAQKSSQAAAGMIEDALAYTGLIAIPGLIGGVILGERLLRLYGEEFVEGVSVLGLLILAVLIYSYQKQLMNGLNGLNRPDLAFRINAVFVTLNATLNLGLIYLYGIEGAAVATALSAAVALVLSYYMLSQLISFSFPAPELARQWVAAIVMGGIVFGSLEVIETIGVINHNATIVVGLVVLGSGTYFLTLLTISREFRDTVNRNLPVEIPYVR